MTTLAPAFRSSKAAYRPGKAPRGSNSTAPTSPKSHGLKRTSSAISLPSPPDELAQGPLAPSYLAVDDEEEVDELNEDDASSTNPFVVPGDDAQPTEQDLAGRPDHPLTSPTHRVKRRRVSADRVQLGSAPRKVTVERKVPEAMGKGWEDESNPFISRGPTKKDGKRKERDLEPEPNVTYVFRGKRIHYDLPLSALLESEDPSESPYPNPSPRLLFPTGPEPVTPPSAAPSTSFLEALRATAGKPASGSQNQLPPTPVTEKQPRKKEGAAGSNRFGPYKKMKDVGRQEGEKLRR